MNRPVVNGEAGAVPYTPTLTGSTPAPVTPKRVAEPRAPFDFDRALELALSLGGVGFYFAGSAYGAVLLGGWRGAFVLALFGVPPVVYALVKADRRRRDAQQRAEFRGQQAPAVLGDPTGSSVRVYE